VTVRKSHPQGLSLSAKVATAPPRDVPLSGKNISSRLPFLQLPAFKGLGKKNLRATVESETTTRPFSMKKAKFPPVLRRSDSGTRNDSKRRMTPKTAAKPAYIHVPVPESYNKQYVLEFASPLEQSRVMREARPIANTAVRHDLSGFARRSVSTGSTSLLFLPPFAHQSKIEEARGNQL
jgi:hypothetical protein